MTITAYLGVPVPSGTCDGGDCDRRVVSFAWCERIDALIPVCRRHICVYRVNVGRGVWQAEDEFAGLRFARRSRWRWLAQRRILHDQRKAVRGRESRAQRRRRIGAKRVRDVPTSCVCDHEGEEVFL